MPGKYSLILHLRALGWVVNLTRFNFLLLALTSLLLLSGQGHDLLLNLAEDDGLFHWEGISLLAGTLVWAFSIWLWARILLDINFPQAPVPPLLLLPYRKHLPRFLAMAAFFNVIANLFSALNWRYDPLMAVLMIEAVLFYLFLIYRRNIGRRIARRINKETPESNWAWVWGITMKPPYDNLKEVLGEELGIIALITFLLGVVLLAWGLTGPVSLGLFLHTILLVLLWSATVLSFGSLLTYWGNKKGIPVITVAIVIALVFSLFNDNHPIRELQDGNDPAARSTITSTLQQWKREHCDDESCEPFVIVATAGGGIRAAYWTGLVLGDLHDSITARSYGTKSLDDYLFAVSGVSGGSIGAAVYRTVAANASGTTKVRDKITAILGEDYLGPITAGLLYPDTIQRFIPFHLLSDRAAVFERGLEVGFDRHMPDAEHKMSDSFLKKFKGRDWPALFVNSTWSDNGRRIVGATLHQKHAHNCTETGFQGCPAPLYKDLLDTMGYDISLSTAAHNSARFPFVSPAGSWSPVDNDAVDIQRLQDGGLFENFGAETALELLEKGLEVIGHKSFNALVILITSDPQLPEDFTTFIYKEPLRFAHETLGTFHTYATTRSGRGLEAAARLKRWTESHNINTFAYFRMCHDKHAPDPPLGWALSNEAKRVMNDYLYGKEECTVQNRAARTKVLRHLGYMLERH